MPHVGSADCPLPTCRLKRFTPDVHGFLLCTVPFPLRLLVYRPSCGAPKLSSLPVYRLASLSLGSLVEIFLFWLPKYLCHNPHPPLHTHIHTQSRLPLITSSIIYLSLSLYLYFAHPSSPTVSASNINNRWSISSIQMHVDFSFRTF